MSAKATVKGCYHSQCAGCGEFKPADQIWTYEVTYRDDTQNYERFCDACVEIVNAGQAEHAVSAVWAY